MEPQQQHTPSPPHQKPQQVTAVHYHKPSDDGTVWGAMALALAVGFPPVGFVLGIVGLLKSKRDSPGHLLSLIGVLVSVVMTLLFVAYIAISVIVEFHEESQSAKPSDFSNSEKL